MNDRSRPDTMSYVQTVTIVAVIVFALMLVSVERPMRVGGHEILPVALGIVGLLFVAAALMAVPGLREQWREGEPDADRERDLVPLIFEVGLWALAALYVVRLVEISRG